MIVGDMEIRLRADIARLQRDMDDARRVVGDATAGISRAAELAKAALASIGLGAGLSQIIQMSDQYAKFTAQLRLATQSAREYAQAYEDVKRISSSAQADLSATGVLYARIANGTRELGISQKQVANITETVNMALKVSGATAEESASAMLQLSQSFASGTLRGEEFNAVNEAAPRLMLALADGLGVPVGALKKMASEGQITSQIMADVLPKALQKLRDESKEVQTISGAFTVLKNNVMEFTAVHADANGTVKLLTGGIGLLADNLTLLMGVMTTLTAVKIGTWLDAAATKAYTTATANQALMASNVATAESQVAAAGAASVLATARVAELRAAVLAAEGETALAITTNGLIPAQARAAVAAETHAAALLGLSAAQKAASVTGGLVSGAIAFLGGPVGALITVLGLAATAWSVWGKAADDAGKQAQGAVEMSSREISVNLDKQIEKLKERLVLAKAGAPDVAKQGGPEAEKLATTLAKINALKAQGNSLTGADKILLIDLQGEYQNNIAKLGTVKTLTGEISAIGQKSKAAEWMEKLATKTEKMNVELKQAHSELGAAFTPEIEARIRKQYEEKEKGAAKEQTAYQSLITTIGEKIAAGKLEMSGYDQLSESQKLTIKLDEAIKTGKRELTPAHIANAKALIAERAAQEAVIAANKQAIADVEARVSLRKAEEDGIKSYFQSQQEGYNAAVKGSNDALKAAQAEFDQFGRSKSEIAELTLAQLELNLAKFNMVDADNAGVVAAQQQIDRQKELISVLKGTQTKEEYKSIFDSINSTAHDTFISIFNSGKSAFDRLRDTLKNGLLDLLYQMTIKKWILSIGASVTGAAVSGMAQAADGSGGSGIGSTLSAMSSIKSAYSAITTGFSGLSTSVAEGVQTGINMANGMNYTNASLSAQIGSGPGAAASAAGTVASYAAGMAAGKMLGSAISGGYQVGDRGSAVVNVGTVIGAIAGGPIGGAIGGAIGGLVNRAFGMKDKEVQSQGIEGSFSGSGFAGNSFSNWHQDGGWFRGDKDGRDTSALDSATSKQFTQGFDAIKSVSSDFAKSLGLDAGSITNYSEHISVALTNDAAKNQEIITKTFSDLGDHMANAVAPGITVFLKEGESSSATLQRMATSLSAVNGMFDTLNVKLYDTSLAGGNMASKLVDLFGGLDAMKFVSAGYFNSYYSEQEKVGIATRQLTKNFADLGFAMPANNAALRALIDEQFALGESGQKSAVQLMGLTGAFASLTSLAESAKTATLDILKISASSAMSALGASIDAEKSGAKAAFDAQMAIIDAQKSAAQASIDIATAANQKIAALAGSLKSTLDSMKLAATAGADRVSAQDMISRALSVVKLTGVLPDADKLSEALKTVAQPNESLFSSYADFARDYYKTAGELADLNDITGKSLTKSDTALSLAKDQLKRLDDQAKLAQASYDEQIRLYDLTLSDAQQQLDATNGLNTTMLSVTDAVKALGVSIASLAAENAAASANTAGIVSAYQAVLGRAPDAAGLAYYKDTGATAASVSASLAASDEGKIAAIYQSVLGRAPDAAGMAYWLSDLKSGQSLADIQSNFTTNKLNGAHANGGVASGWSLVGEEGPEIVNFSQPARVYTADQSRSMMGGGDTKRLEALVEALTAEIILLKREAMKTSDNTKQVADTLDQAQNGRPFQVEFA